ncbi:DUF4345 domain-containing protein [Owenweeksia hongkongensis]|uniref:DUF4345 domain-containing protein n=1 Tax=Owenweeksia hongkongensis TaxID=253245 RepID=UPI003A917603
MNPYKLTKRLLIFIGIVLFIYALTFLVRPQTLGEIIGFTETSPNALVEVMAFYGGLELGLSLFFFWSSLKSERYQIALTVFIIVFLCAGVSRLLGIILYGFEDPSQPIVTAVELAFPAFAWWIRQKLSTQSISN